MTHNGSKLEALALALARGLSISSAAKRAGVSRRTATRMVATPLLQERVRALRQRMTDRVVGRLIAASVKAVGVLEKQLHDPQSSERRQAAVALLAASIKHTELHDLQARVSELQSRIKSPPLFPTNGVHHANGSV